MVKLSPLDGFTRILIPYPTDTKPNPAIKNIGVGTKVHPQHLMSGVANQSSITRALTNKLYLQWNKILYDELKRVVNKTTLPVKPGNCYIQVGHKKVYGGINVWVVQEPTMIQQVDPKDGYFVYTLACSFLVIINNKELYEVENCNSKNTLQLTGP